jgi:hypothetical protein
VSAPARDWAARTLDLVVRVLPGAKREWRDAMRGELATIAGASERRRFVFGCLRAALLCRFARRPGWLGPAQPGKAAMIVRAGGLALAGGGLLLPLGGVRLPALLVAFLAVAIMAVTARGTRVSGIALAASGVAGLVAGLTGYVSTPFDRHDAPLAHGLPGGAGWMILILFAAPAAAALLAGHRTLRAEQAVMAATGTGAFGSVVFALLGFGGIALFPHSVPDASGPMLPGTSAAARHAESVIAASDTYWGFLAFGTLLAALLWAMARPPAKADLKLAVLALFAVPPIALAVAGGAGTIALATAAVALTAVFTTRREAVAR